MSSTPTLADSRRSVSTVTVFGVVVLIVAVLYLRPFVLRGWIPHDEGTMGQTATRVLDGELPHVDFDDPYTGGLTRFYAKAFAVFGADLATARWATFGAAIITIVLTYAIAASAGSPGTATIAAALALTWGPANYLSSLPSWWTTLFAVACVACLRYYSRTARISFIIAAGACLGLAIAVKQTGVYLLPAVVWFLLYHEQTARSTLPGNKPIDGALTLRLITAGVTMIGVIGLLSSRLDAESAVVLLLPVGTVCAVTILDERYRATDTFVRQLRVATGRVALLLLGAIGPLLLVLWPYIVAGQLATFFVDAFVTPRQRLIHASVGFSPLILGIAGMPYALALMRGASRGKEREPRISPAAWCLLGALVLVANSFVVYQLVWNAARTIAVGVMLASAVALWHYRTENPQRLRTVFASLSVLAFFSLVQFPFAAPIYFCYTVPLLAISLTLLLTSFGTRHLRSHLPVGLLFLGFAVFSLNRGYVYNVGAWHEVRHLDVPLGIDGATLTVSEEESETYQELVKTVLKHRSGMYIHAFPDCPEVYFLSGSRNPTRALFDFFSPATPAVMSKMWKTRDIHLVVINHKPKFSPPVQVAALAAARELFPFAVVVKQFEVRWRQ